MAVKLFKMSSDIERKAEIDSADSAERYSKGNGSKSPVEDINSDPIFSLEAQKSIIHRIDRRLVVTCGFVYCISLIDRSNLGNASIAG